MFVPISLFYSITLKRLLLQVLLLKNLKDKKSYQKNT